ncbi:MAG TPA: NUDIX hydrolase [Candidatus Kapabacteria bacterium]|nr:NUDIX hydrolase [Candidatus Kapabacteria bacterium]
MDEQHTLPRWKTLDKKSILHTRIFDFNLVKREEEGTGREGEFYLLEANDWINVVAITTDNQLVLVRQYRHGTDEFELEIVGGMLNDDESPKDAAIRELSEETGYELTSNSIVEELGSALTNPAFLNNRCYMFLITNVELNGTQTFDEHENITVHLAPLEEMDELVRSGKISHSLVLVAFYWYKLRMNM